MLTRTILHCYDKLLCLYPHRFYAEFGDEMQATLADALVEAAQRGKLAVIAVCLRELKDLPASLLREHWRGLLKGIAMNENRQPGSWLEAALAGLPHLLYAIMLYGPVELYELRTYGWAEIFAPFRHAERWGYAYPFWLAQAFWTLVIAVSLLALWRRVPRWSASWLGYLLSRAFGLAIQFNSPDFTPIGLVLLLSWPALLIGLVLWLGRRDPLAGLLVILPLAPMGGWLFTMETVITDLEGLLYLPAGLLVGVAAALAVRRGSFRFGLLAVSSVIVLMSLPINYSAAYHPSPTFPPTASWNWTYVAGFFVGDLLFFTLLGLPLWLLLLWRIGRQLRLGPRG